MAKGSVRKQQKQQPKKAPMKSTKLDVFDLGSSDSEDDNKKSLGKKVGRRAFDDSEYRRLNPSQAKHMPKANDADDEEIEEGAAFAPGDQPDDADDSDVTDDDPDEDASDVDFDQEDFNPDDLDHLTDLLGEDLGEAFSDASDDDDDEEFEEKHSRLLSLVSNIKDMPKFDSYNNKKKKKIAEQTEAMPEGEFSYSADVGNQIAQANHVSVADLVGALGDNKGYGELKKQLATLSRKGKSKKLENAPAETTDLEHTQHHRTQ
eukprot:TRINITY_DN405_c0_g1_i2.p1 TRINITY_DN405_c0_g1~~TRINITY_DN405_c0_g1_i2.p1  ORF type:complete len:262 (+),score=127.27 TRINITY_DN405_c0_g1_i2:2-787(+)